MKRYCKVLRQGEYRGNAYPVGKVVECKPWGNRETLVDLGDSLMFTQHGAPHADDPYVYLYPEGWEPGADEETEDVRMCIELKAFCAFMSTGKSSAERLGQAFYNHFSLGKMTNQEALCGLYEQDGDEALTTIAKLFRFT